MESVNNGCKLDDGKINQSIIKGIDTRGPIKQDEIESAKAELTGVREENTRLKALLQQIETDYKNLQAQLMDVLDQDKSIKNGPTTPVPATNGSSQNTQGDHDDEQEHELSLCLGMVSGPSESKRDGVTRSGTSNSSKSTSCERDELKLRLLDYNLEGANGNGDGIKEGGVEGEKWPPSKVLKTKGSEEQPEEVGQTSVKRARVCVRARCETQTMNDGCQWRKYGQKIAKGNPCPRAYYRCTVSPLCPVRKQVQRSVEDMSVLITTYEGTHNHPLSASATVLASTTSAAASMLLSGSSTSQPSNITINSPFGPPRPQPYYYPNASSTTLPTITLDLTTQPASTTSTGFNLYSSNFQTLPRVPTSSLSFGSTSSNAMPSLWGNGALSFGSAPGPYNSYPSLQFGKQPKEQTYQPSYLEKFNQGASQQTLTETLTKVITSDPSLRSVLAAAISSIQANGDKGDTFGQNLKLGGHVPAATDSS